MSRIHKYLKNKDAGCMLIRKAKYPKIYHMGCHVFTSRACQECMANLELVAHSTRKTLIDQLGEPNETTYQEPN